MAPKRPMNNLYVDGTFRYGCIEVQDMSAVCLNTANFLSGSNNLILLHNMLLDGKLPPAIENGIVWLN